MLLVIAVAQVLFEKKWESNLVKFIFTLAVSIPTAIYLVTAGFSHILIEQLFFDYVPFIILLLALFVVTGGIHIDGDIKATPTTNSIVLAAGYMIASLMGTTGAAMLLIRPLLSINSQREYKVHTILFFIAMVANCGGMLTPLGDPPLFMLYLRGTPFSWFASLTPEWAFTGVVLLAIYFIWDTYVYRHKESAEALQKDANEITPLHCEGYINLLYLGAIMAAVVFLNSSSIPQMGDHSSPLYIQFLREEALFLIIVLSLLSTKKRTRELNNFSWDPILEVAILFVGIFITMTPALMYLNAHAAQMGLTEPWEFCYATGLLSSFLDNTPTAVAFHSVASHLPQGALAAETMIADVPESILRAISIGAVFFGALTYIGNGPNLMVKAIADKQGVKMPSFFAYMFRFSLVILLPVYIVMQLIFI